MKKTKLGVFVMDDEPDIVLMITGSLEKDFKVYGFSEVEKALDFYIANYHRIHVNLLDYKIPGTLEALLEKMKFWATRPTIIHTAYPVSSSNNLQQLLDSGQCARVLTKGSTSKTDKKEPYSLFLKKHIDLVYTNYIDNLTRIDKFRKFFESLFPGVRI